MQSKVEDKRKFQARKEGEVRTETERVRKLNEKLAEITSSIKQYTEDTDDRTKVIGLMDIYRSHAVEYTEAELERKKPDNALLEEIDRKTRFLEEMSEELKKKTQ
jgi:C4-dicarboxylate-specific signal transduction histidine kinase